MYHVALVNLTDHVIEYAEEYDTHDEAVHRLRTGLGPQAELNIAGLGTCEAGKEWATYGPADKPFEWPAPAEDPDA